MNMNDVGLGINRSGNEHGLPCKISSFFLIIE